MTFVIHGEERSFLQCHAETPDLGLAFRSLSGSVSLHWWEQEMFLCHAACVTSSPHPPCPSVASWQQLWKSYSCVCPTMPGQFLECTDSPINSFHFMLCFEFCSAVICTLSSVKEIAGTGSELFLRSVSSASSEHSWGLSSNMGWAHFVMSCLFLAETQKSWPLISEHWGLPVPVTIWRGAENSLAQDGNASLKSGPYLCR